MSSFRIKSRHKKSPKFPTVFQEQAEFKVEITHFYITFSNHSHPQLQPVQYLFPSTQARSETVVDSCKSLGGLTTSLITLLKA